MFCEKVYLFENKKLGSLLEDSYMLKADCAVLELEFSSVTPLLNG